MSLSPLYCKQLCQYVDALFVSNCTLLQAALPVSRHTVCLYIQVTAISCASMSTHCVSLYPRYCKQLCYYVDLLCVSISTLKQASVPICPPTVCLYLHVTASICASMPTHCVSLSERYCKRLCQYVELLCFSNSTLLQATVPVYRSTLCLSLHVNASSSANMSTYGVSLSPR